MKHLIICIVLILFNTVLNAQSEDGLVKWLTIKEAQELNKKQAKPLLIDVYTDWCGWCKHMMKTTYSNPNTANYINSFFYPVKFNAETKDTIEYNGKVYKPTSASPKTPHELAIKFLGTNLSYPSTIFVSNNFEYNLLSQGYLEDKKIEPLLVYTVENVFKSTNYEEFAKQFNNTFYDTIFKKAPLKFTTWQAIEKTQTNTSTGSATTKKTLVNIWANFCNSCKIQNATTLKDSAIATYISKNFNIINFDAESNDTIVFKNEKHFKQLVNGYPLNTFALRVSNNKLQFPTIAMLDEQGNTLDALNVFLTPQNLMPILHYYAEDKFKIMSWQDFQKSYSEGKIK